MVEPERRFTLSEIARHRWLAAAVAAAAVSLSAAECAAKSTAVTPVEDVPSTVELFNLPPHLDAAVVKHMLHLPNLTVDEISESIQNNSYNHISGIYNLLVEKLTHKKKEQIRLAQHTGMYPRLVNVFFFCKNKKNILISSHVVSTDRKRQA